MSYNSGESSSVTPGLTIASTAAGVGNTSSLSSGTTTTPTFRPMKNWADDSSSEDEQAAVEPKVERKLGSKPAASQRDQSIPISKESSAVVAPSHQKLPTASSQPESNKSHHSHRQERASQPPSQHASSHAPQPRHEEGRGRGGMRSGGFSGDARHAGGADAGGQKRASQDVRGALPPRKDMLESDSAVPPVPQPQAPMRIPRAEAPSPRERDTAREPAALGRGSAPPSASVPASGIDGSSWRRLAPMEQPSAHVSRTRDPRGPPLSPSLPPPVLPGAGPERQRGQPGQRDGLENRRSTAPAPAALGPPAAEHEAAARPQDSRVADRSGYRRQEGSRPGLRGLEKGGLRESGQLSRRSGGPAAPTSAPAPALKEDLVIAGPEDALSPTESTVTLDQRFSSMKSGGGSDRVGGKQQLLRSRGSARTAKEPQDVRATGRGSAAAGAGSDSTAGSSSISTLDARFRSLGVVDSSAPAIDSQKASKAVVSEAVSNDAEFEIHAPESDDAEGGETEEGGDGAAGGRASSGRRTRSRRGRGGGGGGNNGVGGGQTNGTSTGSSGRRPHHRGGGRGGPPAQPH